MDAAGPTPAGAAEAFAPLRPLLVRVAYRMLGSVAEAEDVVQDAFLRWLDTDRSTVREPEAFLRRVVTRLCLDVLKSARRRRETYIGPWLPDPVVAPEADPADEVTLPLLLALDRLSPLERAAFLLHDVFGASFEEVAETIGRDAAAARQLASRARTHVRAARPRFPLAPEKGFQIAEAFFAASRSGDMRALGALLAADVTLQADGGGKRPAASRVIVGAAEVLRLHEAIAHALARHGVSRLIRLAMINGLPGFVTEEADGVQTTALDIADGQVRAIYIQRNPDKLKHIAGGTLH